MSSEKKICSACFGNAIGGSELRGSEMNSRKWESMWVLSHCKPVEQIFPCNFWATWRPSIHIFELIHKIQVKHYLGFYSWPINSCFHGVSIFGIAQEFYGQPHKNSTIKCFAFPASTSVVEKWLPSAHILLKMVVNAWLIDFHQCQDVSSQYHRTNSEVGVWSTWQVLIMTRSVSESILQGLIQASLHTCTWNDEV